MKPIDYLNMAVKLKGSQSKLARAAGVTQTSIWKALQAERVSAELAVAIERATEARIRRQDLRPDLWPVAEAAA